MSTDLPDRASDGEQDLPREMQEFLRTLGHDPPPGRGVPLPGGVSSDIWRTTAGAQTICIKRALPTLRVAAEWKVPVERNRYEYAWFERVRAIVPEAVPPLLGHDPGAGLFAMGYLDPARYPLWKGQLLAGIVDPQFAARVGATLGSIHAATAADPDCARSFATDALFHQIRLEPYLLATARRHPDLAPALEALARRTATSRRALVHGDVSPKNILAGPDGPVFLDAECAWYGDPVFDLAFCLNHLLLKCLPVPAVRERLRAAYDALSRAYLERVCWEPAEGFERRCAALLPALLLARVDGKSPVEYIDEERDRSRVRRIARPMIAVPPVRLSLVAGRWHGLLAS